MPTFVDLSHTIEHGTLTYPGLPAPLICDFMSREQSRIHYKEGTSFQIGKIEMVGNTGTYLDSPFHRYADGKDLSRLPLSSLANLPAVVINANTHPNRAITAGAFKNIAVRGKAVLVHTGWSKHWGKRGYFDGHPFLAADAAQFLRDEGAVLVGIDSLNIDSIEDGARPVHTVLLGAEIPVVEHMCNLDALPLSDFRFFAVPPRVKAFGTFPVRAFALF